MIDLSFGVVVVVVVVVVAVAITGVLVVAVKRRALITGSVRNPSSSHLWDLMWCETPNKLNEELGITSSGCRCDCLVAVAAAVVVVFLFRISY